jgi:hypothetical protein
VATIESKVSDRILTTHRRTVDEILDVAEAVVETTGERTSTAETIVEPLRARLEERSLVERLRDVLVTGVAATDERLQAAPIAGPPYVVVTSRGPLCRGTLTDGRRLVVELQLFAVERRPRTYSYLAPTPDECLFVSVCQSPG